MFLLVGQEPDIPDLIDFMQSGDELKIINAARYLQHLCYSKESVKDKVRYLVENAVATIYFEYIMSSHDCSVLHSLRTLMFKHIKHLNRWNANRCYSSWTTYGSERKSICNCRVWSPAFRQFDCKSPRKSTAIDLDLLQDTRDQDWVCN